MGARGPKPTPTAVLKKRGSWRGKINQDEPQYDTAVPECPAFLSEEGKREWNRVAARLFGQGVLTEVDRAALACYCEAWAEFAACCEVEPETEFVAIWVKRKNDAAARIKQFASEFGMTPSARSRVTKTPAADKQNGKAVKEKPNYFKTG
jgi:P27 family predicted phage terminase small subunit